MRKLQAVWGAVLLAYVAAASAVGDINLELRTENPWEVGETVRVELYAVSDNPEQYQYFSAIRMVFAWDPTYLELLGLDQQGAVNLLSSSFPANDPWSLNETVPPQDGDGLYRALAPFGQPVQTTGEGVLVTTLEFAALAATGGTPVEILVSGGNPAINTAVVDGVVPGLDVTGTLSGTSVRIVPEPGGALLLAGVLGLSWRRARPVGSAAG